MQVLIVAILPGARGRALGDRPKHPGRPASCGSRLEIDAVCAFSGLLIAEPMMRRIRSGAGFLLPQVNQQRLSTRPFCRSSSHTFAASHKASDTPADLG
ncbi:hypothetical protein GCM10010191_65780 [Actinomadura vinacea]|uniref:Uncharacterized protein n=1 Tax=Actinomadura vinacea TaxID=115336 RepID=A0ABP5WZ52_9ACTN